MKRLVPTKTPEIPDPERAALLEEIVRLRTRVAQLEAAALVDIAPPDPAADTWLEAPAEPLDQVADPQMLRRDQLLQATAIGVSSATGEAFFRLLARHLANTLQCDCALVGVLLPRGAERVRSLAFFADRQWLPTIEYDLAGTPCEQVVGRQLCLYPAGVQRLFPRDQWLIDWGIEAYAGTPLYDSRGEVLGLISVLSRSPMADPAAIRSALQIFATRAAAEVERQQFEESLRASQAALAESDERFRQMAETIRDVFWLYDLSQRKLLYISPAFEAVWGVPPDQLYENPQRWLEWIHEDDRAVADSMPVPPSRPGKVFDETYRIRRADGSVAWLHDRRYAVFGASGQCQRLVGVCADITKRREAEELLEQQVAHLAHLARLSTVGELVASISHEVNQPLYAIGNFSAAIVAALEAENPPMDTVRQCSAQIGKAVLRAGDIIRRVRSYVARGSPERRPINLEAIARESAALLSAEARRQRVQIQLDVQPPAGPLLADPVAIQQVLVNLLRNALESLADIDGRPRSVALAARPADGFIEVSVSDSGCGLNAESQRELFIPFYTSKPEGMGMGLAISKSIIEAHGGRIWAEPNAGGGTTLRFTLPAG
jgi:PAS domain S-box-containing protein